MAKKMAESEIASAREIVQNMEDGAAVLSALANLLDEEGGDAEYMERIRKNAAHIYRTAGVLRKKVAEALGTFDGKRYAEQPELGPSDHGKQLAYDLGISEARLEEILEELKHQGKLY